MKNKKVILIVLDSVGCGNAPDARQYGDEGANTLGHIAEKAQPRLPNMEAIGLGNIPGSGFAPAACPTGLYGRCIERSAGKDTTTGHWEIAGLPLKTPFPTYPNGFPADVIEAFERATGRGVLGNRPASGTAILDELGEEHMRTGKLIVYTSADSVFQIAAHEDIVPPQELWHICEQARALLQGEHGVGRVIARPFIGKPGAFVRTGNRRDFSLTPPSDTMLDVLSRAGLDVWGVGKIEDIFAHRGLTQSIHSAGNPACIETLLSMMEKDMNGLIFVNLVDFDSVYGHRRDVAGYAKGLEEFDAALPQIMARMGEDDVLMMTADHGCDPTYRGTDHTREMVPLLCWGHGVKSQALGTRDTYGDIAATILERFDLKNTLCGTSFAELLK
ncbi:MAG: phosphopentomutase [Clostridiales bacterium]|nr:phosphopentomutase [Clostridiales bacterium]